MSKTNIKRKKSTPQEVDHPYSIDDYPTKGIIPMVLDLVELLPEDMKPHGKRIVGVLTGSVIAILSIFLIGVFVASLTGHSDQIMNIFAATITGVGIVSVAAIARTTKTITQ